MRSKAKVLLAVMAYGSAERPELGIWRSMAAAWSMKSPLIEDVIHTHVDVCPTPVARNLLVKAARDHGCDIIFSVDADTVPAAGFFQYAIEMLVRAKRPCVILAPYVCGGGPPPGSEERVQVFQWRTDRTDDPNELARLDHIPREVAAFKTGIEPVACGGTGCYACHTEVFDYIGHPYFRYEHADKTETMVVATEDVHAFRDLTAAGVQLFCAWDHWATHWKLKAYGKPAVMSPDEVWGRTKKLLQDRDLNAPDRDPGTDGWFDYADLYDRLVKDCRPNGVVVEVGSFTGRSFVHLASVAKGRGDVLCVSVDSGLGGTEPNFADMVKRMGGTSASHLARRLMAAGLTEGVLQIVGLSVTAARQFADGSLDAVFLDADHDAASVEADIRAWWPKLRPGGTMAGHDWDRPGVRQGCANAGIPARLSPLAKSCWECVKPEEPEPILRAEDICRLAAACHASQEATQAEAARAPVAPPAAPRKPARSGKRHAKPAPASNGRA